MTETSREVIRKTALDHHWLYNPHYSILGVDQFRHRDTRMVEVTYTKAGQVASVQVFIKARPLDIKVEHTRPFVLKLLEHHPAVKVPPPVRVGMAELAKMRKGG